MSKINLISLLMITLAGTTKGVILRTSCKSFADFSIVLDGFYDSGAALKSLDGKTRRQCLLECKSTVGCKSINFQKDGGLCQLLDRNITSSKNFLQSKALWTFISTDDNKNNVGEKCKKEAPCKNGGRCEDTCDGVGFKCTCKDGYTGTHCEEIKGYSSCQAAFNAGHRNDGVYYISNAGYHYCAMTNIIACDGGGGYTLVMRTDGALDTFGYASPHWTTSSVYNHVFALRQGLHGEEAKFDGFNKLPFSRVCIGFKDGSTMAFMTLEKQSTSLLDLFNSGYQGTNELREKWLSLLPGGGLQPNCNRQGFSNKIDAFTSAYVRIGIIGNEQDDCSSPDSALGIGIGGAHLQDRGIHTGALINLNEGRQEKVAKGYIFIQ